MNREDVCDACPHSLGTPEGGDLRCPHLPAPYAKPCQLAALIRDPEAVCPGPDAEWRTRFAAASTGSTVQGCGGAPIYPPPSYDGPMPQVEQWDAVAVAATAEPVLLRLEICGRCHHHTAEGRCVHSGMMPVGALVGKTGFACPVGLFPAIGQ